jgi:hypothetical protein
MMGRPTKEERREKISHRLHGSGFFSLRVTVTHCRDRGNRTAKNKKAIRKSVAESVRMTGFLGWYFVVAGNRAAKWKWIWV